MLKIEKDLRNRGYENIAGTDEAGRGPLAGPVVAAAVIFPRKYQNKKIKDSKVLTALERQQLFVEIKSIALTWSTGIVGWKEIDSMGILNASKLAMRKAVMALDPQPDFLLADAVTLNLSGVPQMAIIKGDSKSLSIAAASILAKVTRDQLMMKYAKKYPQYSFDQHMGYGTEIHLKAIKEHGPSPIHRMTFKPLGSVET